MARDATAHHLPAGPRIERHPRILDCGICRHRL